MKATRPRALALVLLALSWSARAQEPVPPPDPSELDRAPERVAPDVPPAEAQEAYELQAIGFDDFGGVVSEHGQVKGTVQWSVPYEGKYKKPLVGADFYRKLGRADLVRAYEDREALRTGLMVGGGLVALAGLVAAVALASSQTTTCAPIDSPAFPSCQTSRPDPAFGWLAVGGVVAGGGAFLAGSAIDPDPVDAVGKRELADGYNRELWQRVSSGEHAEGVDVHVTPQLIKDGAGVSLAVRF